MSSEKTSQQDDVFTIYPAHLRRLMEEHHLTVPEICAALGMPSLQEWYLIQKKPDQPVRHPRILQTARIYLRHPERLPVSSPSIRQFVQRSIRILGDEERAKRIIEALLHKQWASIEKWMSVRNGDQTVDVSIRRLIDLMMQMSDEEFLESLLDGSTGFYVQVSASPVHVFVDKDTGQRLYSTAHQPEYMRDIIDILDVAPIPGRRLKDEEFFAPQGEAANYAEVIAQMGESTNISDEQRQLDEALQADKGSLAWHKEA